MVVLLLVIFLLISLFVMLTKASGFYILLHPRGGLCKLLEAGLTVPKLDDGLRIEMLNFGSRVRVFASITLKIGHHRLHFCLSLSGICSFSARFTCNCFPLSVTETRLAQEKQSKDKNNKHDAANQNNNEPAP